MKTIVVGGGPAGCMSAIRCSQLGDEVVLIDGNEKIGKKLFITGKGRCNLTNDILPNDFLEKVVNNKKFLFSAINKFTPQNTINFFENLGVMLKIERGGRVFPNSNKSSDIIKALNVALQNSKVKVLLNNKVTFIEKKQEKFFVYCGNICYECDKLVLATGGKSYSGTGSTGDGYKFAKYFGHNIIEPVPALVPIKLKNYDSSLSGLALKNVNCSVCVEGKTFNQFGEMLFTHNGVSGPIVLSLSSLVNRFNLNSAKLVIDFKPALSILQLEQRFLREFEEYKNKQISTYMATFLPKNFVKMFLAKAGIDGTLLVNQINKQQRQLIINLLKAFDFEILALDDINVGIVTSGGVDVKQINSKNMESKLVKNLFFVGEMLDVDAFTGGYNIQIALSSGYAVGN